MLEILQPSVFDLNARVVTLISFLSKMVLCFIFGQERNGDLDTFRKKRQGHEDPAFRWEVSFFVTSLT